MSAMSARPFLKWAGGKNALADDILRAIGPRVLSTTGFLRGGRYFEPLMGGAAMFWRLHEMGIVRGAVLSDANAELVTTYRAVRDMVEGVIGVLRWHSDCYARGGAEYYYAIRAEKSDSPVTTAGRMIFLNKAGFNGLYRVNRKGVFNVPHGRTASGEPPNICDADNLRACSAALQGVEILCQDATDSLLCSGDRYAPRANDLVYLDPPYEPEPGKASFTAYAATYGASLQGDASRAFRELAARGVYVVASNSDTPRIRELYAGFRMVDLWRVNNVNSDPTKRGKVKELLILGWNE